MITNVFYNGEGYFDPTAGLVISGIMIDEHKRKRKIRKANEEKTKKANAVSKGVCKNDG